MSQLQVTGEAKIRDIQGPVVANSGVITALDGDASQYVRGDGTLADFPTSSGGGSSVSYYLNSSVSQGTIGGVSYRELSKDPIIGAGTDIAISTTGYVASYITDANDPDVVIVPGGNFNCEFYFSVNNNTGNPTTYAELYKYDGTTFTLLGTSSGVPESINQGTTIAPYYFAIPVATAALALTDRLAIRIYVNVDGRTVTLHTENGHLCQVVTTLSKGMVSLNNLTDQSQFITTGTIGTNFNIVSSGDTHTFNLPVASAANTGKLSSTDWSTFNNKQAALSFTAPLVNSSNTISIPVATSTVDGYLDNADWVTFNSKQNAITLTTTGTSGVATLVGATLNIPDYTTDLSGYLPLTGGTLTGALNGTSASFSGNITSNLSLLVNRFSNGDYLALKIENRPITAGNNGSGFIAFYSNSGDATSNTYTTGKIYGKFDANSYNSARISLATVTGNEIYQDVLTAKDTNVGIGTINPAQTLHLFTTSGTGSGVGTSIQIQSAGTGADQGWVGVNKGTGNGLTLSVQTNNIIFNTGASTPFGGTERMRVTNGGDVGIGIISPLYKLDVDGTGRFSNTLYIGSSTGFISDAMLVAQINTPLSSDRYFAVNNNGAYGLVMGYTTTSGRARIANISNSPMTLETNNIVALTLAANQTATFASSVTATSIIKTGGTSSQFLMADGSVNTSVLPSGAYLPLTGGTLTGALTGTSATFSSSVSANSLIKTGGTSAQILAADGSVITAGTNITISGGTISSSGAITGSGTTNYVTKFTGASSIGNSLIFDNGTNIGIGLTSPSYKLDVQDNGVSGIVDVASFSVTGNGGSGRGVGILIGAAGSSNSVQVARLVGYQELANPVAVAASFAIQVANASGTLTERLRITQAGNLLIGSTTDNGSRLQVTGAATFTGALSGTSATFSSTANSVINIDTFPTSAGEAGLRITDSTRLTILARTGSAYTYRGVPANSGFLYSNTKIAFLADNPGGGFTFHTGDSSQILSLASTGAATFSSSVTAGGTGNIGLILRQGTATDRFKLFVGSGSPYIADDNYISSNNTDLHFLAGGSGTTEIVTFKLGGNVGIGTSSPNTKLTIQRSGGDFGIGNGIGFKDQAGTTVAGIGIEGANTNDMQIMGSVGIRFYTNSDLSSTNERMRITSGGNVGIGNTGNSVVRLNITGVDSTSSNFGLNVINSSGTPLIQLRNDGQFRSGDAANSPYNYTVTGRALFVDSSGFFGYLASVRESKTNINSLSDISWLYKLNAVSFNYRKKDDDNNYTEKAQEDTYYGLIADEVEKVNKDLVFYNIKEDGTKILAGVEYNKLISALVKSVQELKLEIEQLKNK